MTEGLDTPLACGGWSAGESEFVAVDRESEPAGETLLPLTDAVSFSSGMVENFLRTCLSAGLRIGLLRKWSMPES